MGEERRIYREAKLRVQRKKGFFNHLSAFIIVGVFFFVLNIATDPFDAWFFYPMLPWSVGLAFHYVAIFGFPGFNFNSKEWEEKQMEKEIDKIKKREHQSSPYHLESPEYEDDELDLKPITKMERQNYDNDELV